MRGLANYDRVTVNYYLQDQTLFEAFKKGDVDLYADGSPTHWRDSYNFPAVRNGEIVREEFKPKLPSGMFGFVFNTRRPLFQDQRVREALTLAFDFEWVDRNLFGEVYDRTESFWQNSDLSSYGRPASPQELALIGDMKKAMEPAFIDGSYKLPVTDGSGRDRKVLRHAVDLLKAAGYTIRNGRMVDVHGRQLAFEIMTQNPDQEKIALAYQRFLTAIGVDAAVRTVDDSSYQQRSQSFDYDVILKSFPSSLSPGIEQVGRWGSQSRDIKGTDSFAGVADPGIDRILNAIVSARGQEDFVTAVRALDRVLMSRYYVAALPHRPAMGGASQEPDASAGDAALWLLAAHLVGWHRPGAIKSKLETDCFLVFVHFGMKSRYRLSKPLQIQKDRRLENRFHRYRLRRCLSVVLSRQGALEQALAMTAGQADVAITWRPYRLNPDIPAEGIDHQAWLASKFGGKDKVDSAHAQIAQYGKEAGSSMISTRSRSVRTRLMRTACAPLGPAARPRHPEQGRGPALQGEFHARPQCWRP